MIIMYLGVWLLFTLCSGYIKLVLQCISTLAVIFKKTLLYVCYVLLFIQHA